MAISFDAELDAYIDTVLEDYGVPGAAITVVKDGAVYLKSYGVKRIGTEDRIGENTAFLIASCSKAYTAAAIALLVDEGALGWDDKVHEVLPEFTVYDPWITRNLTIRDLLTMRIGLQRQGIVEWGRNYDIAHEEAFRRLQYTGPECGFREKHVNLNPAYSAISVIVERVSGLRLRGIHPPTHFRAAWPSQYHFVRWVPRGRRRFRLSARQARRRNPRAR